MLFATHKIVCSRFGIVRITILTSKWAQPTLAKIYCYGTIVFKWKFHTVMFLRLLMYHYTIVRRRWSMWFSHLLLFIQRRSSLPPIMYLYYCSQYILSNNMEKIRNCLSSRIVLLYQVILKNNTLKCVNRKQSIVKKTRFNYACKQRYQKLCASSILRKRV